MTHTPVPVILVPVNTDETQASGLPDSKDTKPLTIEFTPQQIAEIRREAYQAGWSARSRARYEKYQNNAFVDQLAPATQEELEVIAGLFAYGHSLQDCIKHMGISENQAEMKTRIEKAGYAVKRTLLEKQSNYGTGEELTTEQLAQVQTLLMDDGEFTIGKIAETICPRKGDYVYANNWIRGRLSASGFAIGYILKRIEKEG